jgi:hypothetical protein
MAAVASAGVTMILSFCSNLLKTDNANTHSSSVAIDRVVNQNTMVSANQMLKDQKY